MVQKSFTLISAIPDKVLRWIGGQPDSAGQEAAQWAEESKKQVETAGTATSKAQSQISKDLGGKAMKGIEKLKGAGPKVGASVDKSTPKGPEATPSPAGDNE